MAGDTDQIAWVCLELKQRNYIDWWEQPGPNRMGGVGKITSLGIRLIEGKVAPAIPIMIKHPSSVEVPVQAPLKARFNLDSSKVLEAIDHSDATAEDKTQAKVLWSQITNNPAFAVVIGVAEGKGV
jgi:hypothetical protein